LGLFTVTGALMIGCRLLATRLAEKVDERAARLNRSEMVLQAYEVDVR